MTTSKRAAAKLRSEQAQQPAPEPEPSASSTSRRPAALLAPSVWREFYREGGQHLVVVLSVTEDRVEYLPVFSDAKPKFANMKDFLHCTTWPQPEVNPHHLIFSLLTRMRRGTFDMRVREERRLAAMLTCEELMTMSERKLAEAYATVMGVQGPARIKSGEARTKYVQEMLARIQSEAAAPHQEADAAAAPENGDAVAVGTEAPRKRKKAAVKDAAVIAAKAIKATAAKAKKTERERVKTERAAARSAKRSASPLDPIKAGENPFRAGAIKHDVLEYFFKVKGNRDNVIQFALDKGAKPSSAGSWYSAFVKRTGISGAASEPAKPKAKAKA